MLDIAVFVKTRICLGLIYVIISSETLSWPLFSQAWQYLLRMLREWALQNKEGGAGCKEEGMVCLCGRPQKGGTDDTEPIRVSVRAEVCRLWPLQFASQRC